MNLLNLSIYRARARFDILPYGQSDIRSLRSRSIWDESHACPEGAYRARSAHRTRQGISKIPSGIYIAAKQSFLSIYRAQTRFDILPYGQFDIRSLRSRSIWDESHACPEGAYRARSAYRTRQGISKIPSGIYIAEKKLRIASQGVDISR